MRFASDDAPLRETYISVARGVSVSFNPDDKPYIQSKHIDGPVLHLRNSMLHWLTLRERLQVWLGFADAFTLEQKHAPDFVRRWNARRSSIAKQETVKP